MNLYIIVFKYRLTDLIQNFDWLSILYRSQYDFVWYRKKNHIGSSLLSKNELNTLNISNTNYVLDLKTEKILYDLVSDTGINFSDFDFIVSNIRLSFMFFHFSVLNTCTYLFIFYLDFSNLTLITTNFNFCSNNRCEKTFKYIISTFYI